MASGLGAADFVATVSVLGRMRWPPPDVPSAWARAGRRSGVRGHVRTGFLNASNGSASSCRQLMSSPRPAPPHPDRPSRCAASAARRGDGARCTGGPGRVRSRCRRRRSTGAHWRADGGASRCAVGHLGHHVGRVHRRPGGHAQSRTGWTESSGTCAAGSATRPALPTPASPRTWYPSSAPRSSWDRTPGGTGRSAMSAPRS